ncbi:glycoside hydrolase family 25 protein [Pantoea sp. AS142]|uniref:glycoside hydrolase family 25 protein n=1 Tax=Pantoea sp. AS142 TaxID=3081292 RepID=UPI0030180FE4
MYKKGIDVSHWQGDIDFEKVAATGIEYVFIKATEGATGQDAKYLDNRNGFMSAGVIIGAYHYFRALSSTPEAQRDNIVTTLTAAGYDSSAEYFIVDAERSGNEAATPDEMADKLYQLMQLLNDEAILGGRKPLIYCSNNFWNNYISGNKYAFSEYPLWIANWNVDEPAIPATWTDAGKSWSVWQYSDKGRVDGINEDVDLDWVRLD